MKNALLIIGRLRLLLVMPKYRSSTFAVHNCFRILKSINHFPRFCFFLMKAVEVITNQKKCVSLSNQSKIYRSIISFDSTKSTFLTS
jgi:hypothetical protein